MKKHDKALDVIIQRPHLVGISNVVLSAKEVNLFDYTGRMIGQPDAVLMDRDRQWHVIEYQCTDKHRDRAIKQLSRGTEHLFIYGIRNVSSYYIFGENNVEEIK